MFHKRDKIQVTQSNGLVLRDNPNLMGTVIKNIPNDTQFEVYDIRQDNLIWLQVKFEDRLGWIVAGNNTTGHMNAKVLPKPKKKYRYSKKKSTKETAST